MSGNVSMSGSVTRGSVSPGGSVSALVSDYVAMRRGLGYRSAVQERALRAFARHLDRAGHRGAIPLEASLDWASATASPRISARSLARCPSEPASASS